MSGGARQGKGNLAIELMLGTAASAREQDTVAMSNHDYFQLKAQPGESVEPGGCTALAEFPIATY